MDKFAHLVFLTFAVATFLLGRYDFAIANVISALGFALSEYRFHIVVGLKLQHHFERKMRIVGNFLGYLGIAILFAMIAMKFIK